MGPLKGLRIIELAGIGPGPMAAMLLADMGATVLRVERPTPSGLGLDRPARLNFLNRGRRSVVVDLKRPEGVALSGALHAIGRRDQPPTPPLNLVGDYGGAVYLCMGMLAAMIETQRSGLGQVVDAAMVSAAPTAPEAPGESTDAAMREWGFSDDEIGAWRRQGALLARPRASG